MRERVAEAKTRNRDQAGLARRSSWFGRSTRSAQSLGNREVMVGGVCRDVEVVDAAVHDSWHRGRSQDLTA